MDSVYSSRRRWLFFAGVLAILGSVVAWPLIPDDRDSPGNDAIIVWTSFGCGAVTPDGKELIPFDYQEIRKFNSLRIAVARRIGDGHLGCIDFLGNTLVPFEWDEIYEFNDAGQAWAVRGNESFLIDAVGNVADQLPVRLTSRFDDDGIARATLGKRKGLVNRDGTFLSEPRFSWIGDFDSIGLAAVCVFDDGLYGFIDRSGAMKIPAIWSYIDGFTTGSGHFDKAGWAKVCDSSGKTHWIDRTGKIVLSGEWDQAGPFVDFDDGRPSLAAVSTGKKWGYIDRTGKSVIPAQFNGACPFDNSGLAAAAIERDGRSSWGWIDRSGQFVISPVWDFVHGFDQNGRSVVSIDGREGCIDRSGRMIVEPRWTYLQTGRFDTSWPDGMFFASDAETSKLINSKGEVIQNMGEGNTWARFQKTSSHGWLIQTYVTRSVAADALIPSSWIPYSQRRFFGCVLSVFGAGEESRLQEMNGNVIWTSNDKTRHGMAAVSLFIASLLCVAIWEQEKKRHAIIERTSGLTVGCERGPNLTVE